MTYAQEARQRGWRSLVWPGVFTLAALPILIGLGVWQVERLNWKEQLIAAINEGLGKAPAPLEEPADAWKDLANKEYRPVSVSGSFRHADERLLFATQGSEMGWHVYTPLETAGGKLLFVNRGFVPERLKDPAVRADGQTEGEVRVQGLLRKPGVEGWFDPPSDAAHRVFFWRDLAGMTALLPREEDRARVLPFFVDAAAEPANPGGWPKGGVTRLDIPNRHLEYALTWFGLAVTLIAVFGAFAWTRLKSRSD